MALTLEQKKLVVRRVFEEGFNEGNLNIVDEVVAPAQSTTIILTRSTSAIISSASS